MKKMTVGTGKKISQADREAYFNGLIQGEEITLVPENKKATVVKKNDVLAIIQRSDGERFFFLKSKIQLS